MKIQISALVFIFALVVFNSLCFSQNEGHPLITAYEGSYIESQEVKEFDEQQLVISQVEQDGTVKTKKLEGKVKKDQIIGIRTIALRLNVCATMKMH